MAPFDRNHWHGPTEIAKDTIIDLEYDDLEVFSQNISCAKKNGKYGFIDRNGKTIIPFEFDETSHFTATKTAKVNRKGSWGLIDTCGNELIPTKYQNIDNRKLDSLIIVQLDDKWAFFNLKGRQLSDFSYEEVVKKESTLRQYAYVHHDLIVVKKSGQYGILNSKFENFVESGYYSTISPFNKHGLTIVKRNNLFGVLNLENKHVIPIAYDSIYYPKRKIQGVHDDFILMLNDKLGFANEFGKIQSQIKYDELNRDYCKLNNVVDLIYHTKLKNKEGLINFEGHELLKNEYEKIYHFWSDSITIALKNGRYGLINAHGETFRDFNYYLIEPRNLYFKLLKMDHCELIRKEDKKTMFGTIYENIEPCFYDSENKFIAKSNGLWGMISANQDTIFPFEYDSISNWVEYGPQEHFVIKKGKHGLVSREGEMVIPPVYDDILVDNSTLIRVMSNGLYGTINWNNEIIHPIKYESILWEWPFITGHLDTIYLKENGKYFSTDIEKNVIQVNVSETFIKDKFEYYLN